MVEKEPRGYLMLNDKTYFVYDGLNTIGRNPHAVLNIKNVNISQMHAIITVVDEERHYISDLKSANGTIMDHEKLTPLKLYSLKHGASVKLANIYGAYKKLDSKMGLPALNDTQSTQSSTHTFYGNNTQILAQNTQDSTFNELPTQINSLDEDSNSSIDFVTMTKSTRKFDSEEVLSQIQPVLVNRLNLFDSDEEEVNSSTNSTRNRSRYVISDDESETDAEDDKIDKANESNLIDSLRLSASQRQLDPTKHQQGQATEETTLEAQIDPIQERSDEKEIEKINAAQQTNEETAEQSEKESEETTQPLDLNKMVLRLQQENSSKETDLILDLAEEQPQEKDEEIRSNAATQPLDLGAIQEDFVMIVEERELEEQQKDDNNEEVEKKIEDLEELASILEDREEIESIEATQQLDLEPIQENLVIPSKEQQTDEDNEKVLTPDKKVEVASVIEEIEGDLATRQLDLEPIQGLGIPAEETELENLQKDKDNKEVETPHKTIENLEKLEDLAKDVEIEGDVATQQLDLETIDQELAAPAVDTDVNRLNGEDAQAGNLGTNNQNLEDMNIYDLPTQKLSKDAESSRILKKDNDEDIYWQSTQTQDPFVNNSDDDSFLCPTQDKLTPHDVSRHSLEKFDDDDDDEDFLQPTQSPKQTNIFRKPSLSLKKKCSPGAGKKPIKLLDDNDFLAPTQAMELLHGMELEEEVVQKPKKLEDELESIFASQNICTQKLVAVLERPEETIEDSLDNDGILSSQSIRDILGEGLKVPIMSPAKDKKDTKSKSEESIPSTSTGIGCNTIINQNDSTKEEKKKNVKSRCNQQQNNINEQKENILTEVRSTRGRRNKTATIDDNTITDKKKISKLQHNKSQEKLDNIDDSKEENKRGKNTKRRGKNQSDSQEKSDDAKEAVIDNTKKEELNENNWTNLEDNNIKSNKKRNDKTRDKAKTDELNKDSKTESLRTRSKKQEQNKTGIESSDNKGRKTMVEPSRTRGRKPKLLDFDSKKVNITEKKSTNDEDKNTLSSKPRNVKTRGKNKVESQEKILEGTEKSTLELSSTRNTRENTVESVAKIKENSDGSSEDEETILKMLPLDTGKKTRGRPAKVLNTNKRKLEESGGVSEKKLALDDSSADFRSSRLVASTPLQEIKASRSRVGSKRKGANFEENQATIESPKKSRRLSANSRMLKLETSVRHTEKRVLKPKVAFTMIDDPALEVIVRRLGGSVVDTVKECSVLITENVKRTHKLLCAVGLGKAIVSPDWLHSCKKNSKFLDCWDYILQDKEAEKKWNFSLRQSLARGAQTKLLEGHVFQLIVSAGADVLKGAIESCGGSVVTRGLANAEEKLFIVSTQDQKAKYSKIVRQNPGIKVIEPEAIFDGTLRQEFKFNEFTLN